MTVMIRLMRIGKKNSPSYRIIAVDKRKKRTGSYIEKIGLYNPMKNPAIFEIDKDKFEKWKNRGAVYSEGITKLLKNKKI